MKKFFIFFMLLGAHLSYAQHSTNILWMQQPAISPDGKWIAFEYKGGIYKVAISGGEAVALTANSAYNGYPVWSHDGKNIAFASNRYGNSDVFIIPSTGGTARRLTFDSARDIPYDFSKDNNLVYFGTNRHDISTSVRFPLDNFFIKLYSVPVNGGRNLLVNSAGTENVHFNKAGDQFLFQDRKGYENSWRKHHQSSAARDIWVYNINSKKYNKLSDFEGEDLEPVWGEGNSFYYLSERNGTLNLFESSTDHPKTVGQLTHFTKDPVRNLSRSDSGIFAFTQGGQLYTFQTGQSPRKIDISIPVDFNADQVSTSTVKENASEMAVSPSGNEIAFVAHGEVYVSAINGSYTKRITNTTYREGMVSFSPDGRSLIYSVEKEGIWSISVASIANKNEPYFYAATIIDYRTIIAPSGGAYEGVFSPDGLNIAYVEERNTLKVYNVKSKTSVTVFPAKNNYSAMDGDFYFSWSPDSHYLLTTSSQGHENNDNVILIKIDGDRHPVNLTKSGFDTENPQWGLGGKMIYYLSNKDGLRNLAQGAGQSDIFALFLDRDAYQQFRLSANDMELQEKIMKPGASDSAHNQKAALPQPKPEIQEPDLTNLANRTIRLSQNSAEIADVKLSHDGEKLYFLANYDGSYDLWLTILRKHETKKLTELNVNSGSLEFSRDGKDLFVLADGKIIKINAENGNQTTIGINPTIALNAESERAAIFEHVYQRMLQQFFDPKLQGVDWKYYHDEYATFLPHINNNYDFQVLLSEFLGELNSSHTGGSYNPSFPDGDATAALGLLYDLTENSKGLTVKKVLKGGPFDTDKSDMRQGYIIDKIEGIAVSENTDWAFLLNHKKGLFTQINFHNPKTGTAYREVIKPINNTEEKELLYNRWVSLMEHLTDSLSGGKVGYIHVRVMDEQSYRTVVDKVNGENRDKKAVIIDTRYNGGGNIHDQLVKFLSLKASINSRPQSAFYIQDGLPDGSSKPTCVLMNETNYSDAFNFPYLYRRTGVGKLIGTPVAGTGTGVYWETEIDKTLTVGFPYLGLSWPGETVLFENHQLEPDITVYNDYDQVLNGRDQQLETAVKEMLKTIK